MLFVPSLVNRAYVLDLMAGASMLRFLAASGARPFLLDWGWPGHEERAHTIAALVAGPLAAAAEAATAIAGPPVLAGYCMGGLLALAAAAARPAAFRALLLLATPWDFAASARAGEMTGLLARLEPAMRFAGAVPVDALQALFAAGDGVDIQGKFRRFATVDPASDEARRFVAVEDWLNDGVPLAAPVAREVFTGWYGRNDPGRGAWRVGGQLIDPAALELPAFVAVPGNDRIVPPESALPLAAMLPRAVLHRAASGHIGMVVGRRAPSGLWQPVVNWLRSV